MNKILIIDPGKGWGHFVSKMYCYQRLAEDLNTKITFLTKKSTQAKNYLENTFFCEDIIYLDEPKKGFQNIFYNIKSFIKNVKKINKFNFTTCYVFHPSIRYLFIAKFSNIKDIWGIGLKFQNFFVETDKSLYANFFSKTIDNDEETLEFVKKITKTDFINYKPIIKSKNKSRDTVGIIIAASGIEKRWPIENYLLVINFLIKNKYEKFLIISGLDQKSDEDFLKENLNKSIDIVFTANKKINEVIPFLKKCKFCIGNDTGFAHLSVNFDISTLIIHGDCPPQSYSKLIDHIDIDNPDLRSASSIKNISVDKVLLKLSNFLSRRDGRAV